MRFTAVFAIVFFLVLIVGCDPGELPIEPADRGNAIITQLEMGPNYEKQIYFDLGTNSLVAENDKNSWDIGLILSNNQHHIIINDSRGGKLAYEGNNPFEGGVSLGTLSWHYDYPSGHLDSTAAGQFLDSSGFYVMDLGVNTNGSTLGKRKFKVDTLDPLNYSIRIGTLNGNIDTTIVVEHDATTNLTCISLLNNSKEAIEPMKEDWDLHFTQYMHLFVSDSSFTPYLVTGVLLNRYEVEAVKIDSIDFQKITREHALMAKYKKGMNTIGYDWKYYDFQDGFIIHPNISYLITDHEERYYKLRFLNFYNSAGEKGAPQFEFQEL